MAVVVVAMEVTAEAARRRRRRRSGGCSGCSDSDGACGGGCVDARSRGDVAARALVEDDDRGAACDAEVRRRHRRAGTPPLPA